MSSLREKALEEEIHKLRQAIGLLNRAHFQMLTTIVYYCGGELTLSLDDYKAAQRLVLTESMDELTQARTWRTRRPGLDGGDELQDSSARGGLLPPDAGSMNGGTQ
jgi:hypothetical protein